MKTPAEIKFELMKLNKEYIGTKNKRLGWLLFPDDSPTKVLSDDELKHRRKGALTAINRIYNFINS
ncbi:MAG TPA: hypothetical protein ENH46_04735 [Candidatus Pacearchaeota archaeon]|nr:hypothetical protein [Candidatus Pacearchaeota archaeon]